MSAPDPRLSAPKVSVVTPTWQRHELLQRCISSVWNQDYPGMIEHIVVSDGPDRQLREHPHSRSCAAEHGPYGPLYSRVLVELPEHDPAVWFGNRARLRGLELATGHFIAYLDDDNAWRPDHLALLVEKLLASGADFVYSRLFRHGLGDEVGAVPPRYAQVDSSVLAHRAGIQPVGWNPGQRADPDWEAVSAWMEAGRTWAFVPKVTCDYFMRGMAGGAP